MGMGPPSYNFHVPFPVGKDGFLVRHFRASSCAYPTNNSLKLTWTFRNVITLFPLRAILY